MTDKLTKNPNENNEESADTVYEISALLNSKGFQTLSNQLITYWDKKMESYNKIKELEISSNQKYFTNRLVFTVLLSALTFIAIGILGYSQLIDKYVVGTLMGMVVGYLFGQAGKQK